MSDTLLLAALWVSGVLLSAALRHRGRVWAARALVISGVPLLGGLTCVNGPWAGLAALAVGTLLLGRLLSPPARGDMADFGDAQGTE